MRTSFRNFNDLKCLDAITGYPTREASKTFEVQREAQEVTIPLAP